MSSDEVDADPHDGRDETQNERMDRNWIELLQETRITQTGTQLLSGFLLTIVFQPTFAHLARFDQTLYLGLVVASTVTTALALAPVHLHRSLFRHHSKAALVQAGHLLLRAALGGLVLVMLGAVLLIADVATGSLSLALGLTAVVALVLVALGALPAVVGSVRVRQWLERSAVGHSQR
jgi:hypothetical protein